MTGKPSPGAYRPLSSPDVTLLGADQWQWLEEQLSIPADLRILGSSIQVLAQGTGWESWSVFPRELERLLALIGDARNLILLSGDVHYAELSSLTRASAPPLWELTSSGLTEDWPSLPPNTHRISARLGNNFGLIEIDWQTSTVRLVACDTRGAEVLSHTIAFG